MRITRSGRGTVSGLAAGLAIALAGCAAQPQMPNWVLDPQSPGGLAAAGCTGYSGNVSVDRRMAVAVARTELIQKIQVQVKAIDELYQSKQEGGPAQVSFSSKSQQVAEQTLSGSSPTRVEKLKFDGREQICAMLELRQPESRTLFREIVKATPVSLSVQEEDALFNRFVSQ